MTQILAARRNFSKGITKVVPTTERKPGADLEALKAVRNKHGAHSNEYKAVLQEISAMRNMAPPFPNNATNFKTFELSF